MLMQVTLRASQSSFKGLIIGSLGRGEKMTTFWASFHCVISRIRSQISSDKDIRSSPVNCRRRVIIWARSAALSSLGVVFINAKTVASRTVIYMVRRKCRYLFRGRVEGTSFDKLRKT